jgi:hypothetical protein
MSDFTAQPPPLPPASQKFEEVVPPRRHFWREQRITIAVAAGVAALVAIVTAAMVSALILLVSQPSGTGPNKKSAGTLIQEGTAIIREEPLEVYYPVPYVSPPNLTLTGSMSAHCILVEQKQDHFKAKLAPPWGNNPSSINWKAEGQIGPAQAK